MGGTEAPALMVRPPPSTGGASLPPSQPLRAALNYHRSYRPGHTVPVPALPHPAQLAAASSASRPLLAAPWTHHLRFLPQGQPPSPNRHPQGALGGGKGPHEGTLPSRPSTQVKAALPWFQKGPCGMELAREACLRDRPALETWVCSLLPRCP